VVLQKRWLELEELIGEYSTARIAVVPSFFEGFGFPASEAMACGLPVVASAAGALPEVVGPDGHAGRLVPPRDPQAMAATIAELLADPARLARMGRNARARVQHAFRWRDAAAGLVEVFEDVRRAAHRRPR
jgi:glycosyltransferase involved in cell wall biosynthesis